MHIRVKNCLEKSMSITFNELKEKHLQLGRAQWDLRRKLQNMAGKLLFEYGDSLSLPSIEWVDSKGDSHPYVEMGVWNTKNGEFDMCRPPQLTMDDDYILHFAIATTLDDHPLTGGYRQGVSVSLWYDHAQLNVNVGDGNEMAHFLVSGDDGGFFEVCAAIKALINLAIDKSMPNHLL